MFRFRQHISIALTSAFILGMIWQSVTIANFYINRETIAEEHCVNKNNPENSNCKGQCHLKKQLEASTPDQEENQEGPAPSKTSVLLLVFAETGNSEAYENKDSERLTFPPELNPTSEFNSDIFTPPRHV